jgi:hypothetical protein
VSKVVSSNVTNVVDVVGGDGGCVYYYDLFLMLLAHLISWIAFGFGFSLFESVQRDDM